MAARPCFDARVTLAINLELRPGRSGASARVELHLGEAGGVAVVRVRGRLEDAALRRLAQTLDDLASRGVRRLLLDCSELHDIPREIVASLIDALVRFESRTGTYAVCGLSHRLRERFRFAGREDELHVTTLPAELGTAERGWSPAREWAS
jgi:anti-anti-sigma regulatory factor